MVVYCRLTPPFTMIGSSVATVEKSKHKDYPEGNFTWQSIFIENVIVATLIIGQ